MLGTFITIGNYFHDLAVALLASNIFVVYYLGKIIADKEIKDGVIPSVFQKLSKVTYWAFAFVIIGGAFRGYFYYDYEYNPAVGKGMLPALIVKHILLVGLTIFGIVVHRKYQKKYAK